MRTKKKPGERGTAQPADARDRRRPVRRPRVRGCLSLFDVRDMAPRPLVFTVQTTTLDDTTVTTAYERGLARLVAHEVDHLDGLLYTSRMRPGVEPIPVGDYPQSGRA
ncbi:peptide deformylase [Streptomyces sp. NBC_01241]|uniref:peptide deformylase n=1 Tax=Streptomyces sp. NBC_01241 TaxID=2903794 RepID=UPI00352EDF82|nr:peptide deformylase [Streptomyces sp. NBC_01241]